MAKTIGTGDHTDFDETRRLLYMALLVPQTKRYNLAGTLVNALVHHHAVGGRDAGDVAEQVTRHVVAAVEGGDGAAEGRRWLQSQIDRITAELED